jgi:hypothetical protein
MGLSLPRKTAELVLPNELSCGQVQMFLALRRCLAEMVEGSGLPAPTSTGIRSELNASGVGAGGSFGSSTAGGTSSIWSRRKVKHVKRKDYPLFYVVANKQDKPLALTAEQVALQLGLLALPNATTPHQSETVMAARPNSILKFDWLCEPAIAAVHSRRDVARYGCTTFVERILAFRERSKAIVSRQEQPAASSKGQQKLSGADTTRALHKANSGARLLHSGSSPRESHHRAADPADVLPSPLASVGPYLLAGEETVQNGSMSSSCPGSYSIPYSPPAAVEGRLLDPSKAASRKKSTAKRR